MARNLPLYRGFSTANYLVNKKAGFMLTNQDLVKQDLLNHIYTAKGERPHQPDFGTRIPLLAFEPLDERTIGIIKEDLTAVCEYDPRVQLQGMSVSAIPDQNMVAAYVDLKYLELNTTETIKLDFKVQG